LALLVKAANEGGYNGKFFTYYAGVTGTPTALGQGGAGRVYQIAYAHYNMGGRMGQYGAGFKAKYNDDLLHRLHDWHFRFDSPKPWPKPVPPTLSKCAAADA
jgi:hypothetical protein